MAKKNDITNLKGIGKGILDTISGAKEPDNKIANNEKSNVVETENNKVPNEEMSNSINDETNKIVPAPESNIVDEDSNTKVIEDNSKSISTTKSKPKKELKSSSTNEVKSKRSFMLTETAIQRLNLLKLCINDKDLSELVEEAINLYFDKNKKSVEALISIYNKVK